MLASSRPWHAMVLVLTMLTGLMVFAVLVGFVNEFVQVTHGRDTFGVVGAHLGTIPKVDDLDIQFTNACFTS